MDSTNSKTRSETGNPIRLSDFQPVTCDALARIGSENDGGYVVPLDAVMAAHALVSFGLSHDWTFERDFGKYNADAIIHCYDHTVSLRTAFEYSIGQLLRFVLLLRPSALRRALTWIDYKTEKELEAKLDRLQSLVDELGEVGCELKDYQTGLVDFTGQHQGREVCLCWKLGEAKIGFWHELQTGFAGRKPVSELVERE